jgi:hypothetical protein
MVDRQARGGRRGLGTAASRMSALEAGPEKDLPWCARAAVAGAVEEWPWLARASAAGVVEG